MLAPSIADKRLSGGRRDDRLEDDDWAVDEEPEVDRAERHQIASDAEHVHREERHAHRRRDAEDYCDGPSNRAEKKR